jgi:hypothetical protein
VYAHFLGSPKCHLEIVEIRGFQILKNVKTWWISMLKLLKWVLAWYKTLIMKMSQDNIRVAQVKLNLHLLCVLHKLLALSCLLPLLEAISVLITFVHWRVVFICDFVSIMNLSTHVHL